ncbi:MAG: hypothetical protein U9R50_02155 [Campylobacterota bacterium]|nr:hypothetical protein [Campylobacterota bacterium]
MLSILKFTGNLLVVSILMSACADLQLGKKAYEEGDYALAEKNFQELSQRGFPRAYKGMGDIALKKNPQNNQVSLEYYLKAYNAGYISAASDIAMLKIDNATTQSELNEVYDWLVKAEKSNKQSVSYKLALMRLEGRGTNQDVDRGLKELNTLATQDYAPAHFYLGGLYHKGQYLAFSDIKALGHYNQADYLGSEYAKLKIADINAQKQSRVFY